MSKRLSHLEKEPIMLRSMAVLLALSILPSFGSAQEQPVTQQGTHEVVKGETLWALAERYLGDPFRWPLIFEANRDRIEDPHWIYPHQVFIIPGLEVEVAQVQGVDVVEPGEQPAGAPAVAADRSPCPSPSGRTVFYGGAEGDRGCAVEVPSRDERTAFYSDPSEATAGITSSRQYQFFAVPRTMVYATPWLEAMDAQVPVVGHISALASVDPERTNRERASVFEKVQIQLEEGVTLRVGDLLQSFSLGRTAPELGQVMRPTGVLVVTAVEDAGVVAAVSAEFDPVLLGQGLRRAPTFALQRGAKAVDVESNLTATVLGFNRDLVMQGFGAVAFLDVGQAQGIETGDEFMAYVNRGDGWSGEEAVRLQVVLSQENTASARIVEVAEPVLKAGTEVKLVRKM